VIPPIIAPSGPRGVSDYCPGRSTNQTARNRSACRAPGQSANQRAVPPPIKAPPARSLAVHLHIQQVPMPSQSRPMFYACSDPRKTTHHHRGPDIGQKSRCQEAEKYQKVCGKYDPDRRRKPVTRRREPSDDAVVPFLALPCLFRAMREPPHCSHGPGQKYRAVHIHWVNVSALPVRAAASNPSSQTSNCRTFSSVRSRPISSIARPFLFGAPIEASRVAIPIATPSYSARSHIGAVPSPQELLFFGAVVFLFRDGLASLGRRLLCALRRARKRDQYQRRREDTGSSNSKEIFPFHPIGSPSGRTALCIRIFASISQDACDLVHITASIYQRDCTGLTRIARQDNIKHRAT
jgi:hypothetical protein